MSRMPLLDETTTEGAVQSMLQGVVKKREYVPSPLQVMAHSPATVSGYLAYATALASGVLDLAMRERIAIAVAEANRCAPCLQAHTQFARSAGVSQSEITAARHFTSADPKAAAALAFAKNVLAKAGHVSDADFDTAREAGLSHAELVEIVAHVVLNTLTNAINSIAAVEPRAAE